MSESFIVRRGGSGNGTIFASIAVTYPSESTCTCTNGTKTLTLKDKTGHGIFNVPTLGTWTVTATDGTHTASKSIDITYQGQNTAITLSYINASITVNYPKGFSCTCSDGSTTLTAPATSGDKFVLTSYTFEITNAGSWTVTATNGDWIESAIIDINTTGQIPNLTFEYVDAYINVTTTGPDLSTSLECSNGKETYNYTLSNNGSYKFTVHHKGTWTITGIRSNATEIATVDITTNSQNSIVTLEYFVAYIKVTVKGAPGSTALSCSDGKNSYNYTLSSNGDYQFTVYNTGTWTITGNKSNQNKTSSIDVITNGMVYSVTLSYELYIFKSGVGMTNGYSASIKAFYYDKPSYSIDKNAITWASDAAYGGNMVISPTVDLSNYNTLHVELDYTNQYDGGRVTFGVGNSTHGDYFTASKVDTYNTSKHTITIDVSQITSNLYIKSISRQSAGRFYNIWLT